MRAAPPLATSTSRPLREPAGPALGWGERLVVGGLPAVALLPQGAGLAALPVLGLFCTLLVLLRSRSIRLGQTGQLRRPFDAALAFALSGSLMTVAEWARAGSPGAAALQLTSLLAAAFIGVGALLLLGGRRRQSAAMPQRTVLVVGAGLQGQRFIERLTADPSAPRLIGVFDDRATRVPSWVAGYPVLGTLDDLRAFLRRRAVDDVVLALPWAADERIARSLEALADVPATVRLAPDLAGHGLGEHPLELWAGLPLVTLRDRQRPTRLPARKRWLDRLLACLALAFTLPLLVGLAGLAWATQGAAFAAEPARDFAGRPLRLLALRTRPRHPRSSGANPVGAFLERSRLHRLPRLVDVALGKLALVSPQPHGRATPWRARQAIDRALRPYAAIPGLVSLAAVQGASGALRDPARLERRIDLDRRYLDHWSPTLDAQVLAQALTRGRSRSY